MGKIYVPDQAFLVCTDGMNKQQLKVNSQTTIKIAGGKLAGTIEDRTGGNFNCAKMVVAGAIIGAIVAGIIAAATIATGGFAGALIIGAIAAGGAAGGAVYGAAAGFMPCICALLTSPHKWAPVHPIVLIEKKKALIETSKVACFLGGEVMIFYSEKAADEAVDLRRKKTVVTVGLTMATAFVAGGAFQGFVGAVSTGSTILSKIGWIAFLEYAGTTAVTGTTAFAVDAGIDYTKKSAYKYYGVDKQIEGYDTDIASINDKLAKHNEEVPEHQDGFTEEALDYSNKGADAIGKGNEVTGEHTRENTTLTSQDYARLNDIEEYGETRTLTNVDPDAMQGPNPRTESSYNVNRQFSDAGGTYSEGQYQQVTVNNQWTRASVKGLGSDVAKRSWESVTDWKGMALGFLPDIYKYITNPFLKDEVKDYIDAMLNDEAKAKAGINVYENKI